MKNIVYVLMLVAGIAIASCKKDMGPKPDVAALNVINAAVSIPNAAVNFAATNLPYFEETALFPIKARWSSACNPVIYP
jgi:hypothetical protein